MFSRWIATVASSAVMVVGVICALSSGVSGGQGSAEREMKLYNYYKEIVNSGREEGGACDQKKDDHDMVSRRSLVHYAGKTPIEMYKTWLETVKGAANKDKLFNELMQELENYKNREDRCKLKNALLCNTDTCGSCMKQGCHEAHKIRDEVDAEETTSGPDGPGPGPDPAKPEDGKPGSGTGRMVLPVGGTLLAGLVAVFSLSH